MKAIWQNVDRENTNLIKALNAENRIINYEYRWDELQVFRDEISIFIQGYSRDYPRPLSSKITMLENGHIIDHHALGYFAPMEFKRYGFADEESGEKCKRSHIEQIRILSEYLGLHGVRLIYVPLPCKGAVWPYIFADKSVIPYDEMIIPNWRNVIYQTALSKVEIVDCYHELKKHNSYTKNHHISPVGAEIIGKMVADYITKTSVYDVEQSFITRREVIGSPVLYRSGDLNSIEMDIDYYEASRTFRVLGDKMYPYMGKNVKSSLAIIGDCNLQSYRGTGFDVTAQISGQLRYPAMYIGRYLPFAKNDSIDKLPAGSLAGVDIVVYVGFVSGSFVRACNSEDSWCQMLPLESVFKAL